MSTTAMSEVTVPTTMAMMSRFLGASFSAMSALRLQRLDQARVLEGIERPLLGLPGDERGEDAARTEQTREVDPRGVRAGGVEGRHDQPGHVDAVHRPHPHRAGREAHAGRLCGA